MRIGFDNEKYITMQADRIHQRISEFGGKLYLEFGGKLLDGKSPDASAACSRGRGGLCHQRKRY